MEEKIGSRLRTMTGYCHGSPRDVAYAVAEFHNDDDTAGAVVLNIQGPLGQDALSATYGEKHRNTGILYADLRTVTKDIRQAYLNQNELSGLAVVVNLAECTGVDSGGAGYLIGLPNLFGSVEQNGKTQPSQQIFLYDPGNQVEKVMKVPHKRLKGDSIETALDNM